MGRRRKPGTPGKTKISRDVVKATTRRLKAAFKKTGESEMSDLQVVAQQHYLYLETLERPREIFPGLVEARFAKGRRKPSAVPLGRMVWTGDSEDWRFQLYKWSDEWWDEENDGSTYGGRPEDCVFEACVGWG